MINELSNTNCIQWSNVKNTLYSSYNREPVSGDEVDIRNLEPEVVISSQEQEDLTSCSDTMVDRYSQIAGDSSSSTPLTNEKGENSR